MPLNTAFQDVAVGVMGSLIVVAILFLVWIIGGVLLYLALRKD